jgi:hypothetical protein
MPQHEQQRYEPRLHTRVSGPDVKILAGTVTSSPTGRR